jgi:hypothetical protein
MSSDKCPVTYVSTPAVSGFSNGVVNVAFTTAQFIPEQKGADVVVEVAEYVSANLRMDLRCAQLLHDALTKILDANVKPAPVEKMDS